MTQPTGLKTSSTRLEVAERTRADIIKVALSEFSEKGLSGARVDEIAARTKTSKRMIYYYFGSKDELYRAVLEASYTGIRELETKVDIFARPPEEALGELCGVTFDYHVEHPEFVRIIMNENMLHGENVGSIGSIQSRNAIIIHNLTLLLNRGVEKGVFRPNIDPVDLHMSISALCFHMVANRYTFSRIFNHDMASAEFLEHRRQIITETILSWVKA